MGKMFVRLGLLLLFTGIFLSPEIRAQEDAEITLLTPRNTAYIHLYYLQRDSYEPDSAARAFHPSIPHEERVSLARKLKQVYDGHGLFVVMERIPDNPEFIDTATNEHIYVPFQRDLPNIFLERIDTLWYYSPASVESIHSEHNSLFPLGSELWINLLPFDTEFEFLGLEGWQVVAAGIIAIIVILLHLFISGFIRPIVTRFAVRRINIPDVDPKLIRRISRVISLLIVLYVLKLLIPSLLLPITLSEFLMKSIRLVNTVFIGVLLYRMVELLTAYFGVLSDKTNTRMDKQALPIIDKVLKFAVIIVVAMHALALMDVNVTALVAGMSIGGLALALASQDTARNFIGSIIIFIDQPFQVGDFIQGNNFVGSVVEVGFRSTRIMLINTSIVTIPNGQLSDMQITNFGKRKFRMMDPKISLTYDTPPDRIEVFMEGIKDIIMEHPKIVKENFIVNFFEMADYSLVVFVRAYIDVPDFFTELRVKEEFFLSVMRLAASVGVRFAFPSSTLYIEQFPEKQVMIPKYEKDKETVRNEMMTYLEKNKAYYEKLKLEYEEIDRQKQLQLEEEERIRQEEYLKRKEEEEKDRRY
jgi:MscS family membrane protein